jgi:serine/threonine-protein kinase
MISQGSILAGKYRLDREIARGGMGAVWAARHLGLDKAVAVKLLSPAAPRAAQTRGCFEREARAAAGLDSRHIVRVEDSGADGSTPYLVMELLQGEDLATRLLRERRLPPAEVARILRQIARGIRCVHEAGLVHCDLKPANIFLAASDGEEIVKILDFGLAIEAGAPPAPGGRGMIMGSPHYMSPEQAHGRVMDHRSDLWSLAVLAFQALTGELPFPGTRLADVLLKVCSGPIPRLSEVAPGLPLALDDFFACALRRDPGQRYSSAVEMVEAFAALAGLDEAAAGSTPVPGASRSSLIPPPLEIDPRPRSIQKEPGAPHRRAFWAFAAALAAVFAAALSPIEPPHDDASFARGASGEGRATSPQALSRGVTPPSARLLAMAWGIPDRAAVPRGGTAAPE